MKANLSVVGAVGIAAVIAVAVGCGGDESSSPGMACGAGTYSPDGVTCVPIDSGSSGQGGGSSDASPDVSAGGSAGQGGSAGSDASVGGSDASAGTGGDDAGQDGPTDALEEGMNPGDEACWSGAVESYFNCSDSCGPKWEECADEACTPIAIQITQADQFPVVIRTPSMPEQSTSCTNLCVVEQGEAPVTAFRIWMNDVSDGDAGTHYGISASVEPPWTVRLVESSTDICFPPEAAGPACVATEWQTSVISMVVETRELNAPARNLVINRVPTPANCL